MDLDCIQENRSGSERNESEHPVADSSAQRYSPSADPPSGRGTLAFFQELFRGCDGFCEFRSLREGGEPRQHFVQLPLNRLPKFDLQGDQYFGVAPRVCKRGTDRDVAVCGALWADVDAKAFAGGKAEALALLTDWGPLTPSIIVDSGHGYHCYWLLSEPIEADVARVINEALREAINPALDDVSNPSRILRVPGTINHKNGDELRVRIVHWQPGRRFDIDAFEEFLGIEVAAELQDTRAPHGRLPEAGRIPVGRRNKALISVAGSLRRQGADEAAIREALKAVNATALDVALDEREVETVARSAARYEPATDEGLLRDCTDTGNARILARLHGDGLRYDHRRGTWLVWLGNWWAEDRDGQALRWALEAAEWRARNAYDGLSNDPDAARASFEFALRSRNANRLRACLEVAKALHPLADEGAQWDADPWLLGVANGVLDLKTGRLRPGRREDKIRMHANVVYDPDAECPRWRSFLREVFQDDEELIAFVQRAVGYTLTGLTEEQCLFLLHGKGANGKSVFLQALRSVFGDYAYDPGFAAFEDPGRHPPHPEALAELEGRRFVTASETREQTRLNEQRLKVLAHGDTVSARRLYRDRFEFEPACKLWLAVNHLPRVGDDSVGFWRSIRAIPFRRQFLGSDADKHLPEKLQAEASGILSWAVEGCLAWQEEGLGLPQVVVQATDAYQRDQDPLAEFLAARCLVRPDCRVSAGDLYREYEQWAEDEGYRKGYRLSRQAFGRKMKEKFQQRMDGPRQKRVRTYCGVGLLADAHKAPTARPAGWSAGDGERSERI